MFSSLAAADADAADTTPPLAPVQERASRSQSAAPTTVVTARRALPEVVDRDSFIVHSVSVWAYVYNNVPISKSRRFRGLGFCFGFTFNYPNGNAYNKSGMDGSNTVDGVAGNRRVATDPVLNSIAFLQS